MNFRFAILEFRLRSQSKIQNLKSKISDYASLVRFSHTIFAMPFAMASLALAWPKHPVTLRAFLWIIVAMVGARTAAMAFNRIADRNFDARNPRTQAWELPRGAVTLSEAIVLTILASALFTYAAFQLSWLCFLLSPVALLVVFFYSLPTRFTWAAHFFLGLALSIAPIGAWLAVAGAALSIAELATPLLLGLAVLFWLAGFDVIYSLQDREFDRQQGLYSIPVRFGVAAALRLSSFFHLITIVFLALVGVTARSGVIYWVGFAAVAAVLFWEHRLVTPRDLSRINRAFFDYNAYVSVAYLLTTLADTLLVSSSGIRP
jgi:4-hydroxybenzoate polyprenyltransferase